LTALFGLGLPVVICGRFKFTARLVAVVRVFLFFGLHLQHVRPHEVTKVDITHNSVHDFSCGLVVSTYICTAGSSKPTAQLTLMGDLQPVVVKRYCVNFGHDFLAFIAGMRKNKFEGDRFAEALANNVEE
jgi:hypothetical protein